ncbi:unnamed protein product [Gongylonema pulchrum]|uniref:Uncharacterized protein n=1 Tax=Gongylonema pulchrum TaxID=637853 RepID=A0A3P6RFK6_9BILA|nr:unnamed protein product [Gongylonema pulchrum]
MKGQLVIPDWSAFSTVIGDIFESCQDIVEGNVSLFYKRLLMKSRC